MIEVWQVDLCNYKSVLAFINRVSSLPRLDGLVANAGVEMTDFKLSEGLETTLTVNVVSTYLMAIGVLPKLEESSVHFNAETNLSIVGSMVHAFGPNTQLEVPESRNVLEVLSDPATADMGMRYTLSKLMVHQLFHEFAQRISSRAVNQKSKVVLNNVNPGWCASELSRYKSASLFERGMFAAIGRTAEQGSRTLVHAVTAGKDTHDRYLSECQVVSESTYMRSDRGRRMSARLWRELIARFEVIAPGVAAIVQ